jgi:hypothetical protein
VVILAFGLQYQGIPEQAEVPPVAQVVQGPASGNAVNPPALAPQPVVAPNSGPNANPLDLFPQVCISFICTFKASLGWVN